MRVIKTVAPGGIYTDFSSRSLEYNTLPHYKDLTESMFGSFEHAMQSASTPEFIAETVFEAATDGKDQLKYIAGNDAIALYARREEIGQLATMREIKQLFIG